MAVEGLRFDLEWRITALTAVLLPALVALGFWQLERAEEKAALADAFDARAQAAPAELTMALLDSEPESLAYAPVSMEGEFIAGRHLMLDNRIQDGRFGYEVVSLLALSSGEGVVLVNRGWIPGDPARLERPVIPEVAGSVSLTGHVYVAPGKPYLLGAQQLEGPWPWTLQALEMDKLAPVLGGEFGSVVAPYPVRIDDGQPGALAVDWQIVNVSPAKHRGYAVQWFTMAAVLAIIFLMRSSNLVELLRGRKSETH